MALTSIISNSNRVPGVYLRVSLGVGQRSSGGNPRYVVVVGNKVSAGTMAVETEYDVFSEDEARTLAGARSELFWLAKAAIDAYPGVLLKMIAVTAAGSAATGPIAFTGPATAAGTVGVSVLGEEIEVAYASGDSATVIGAAVATAINNKSDWPLTAASVTGTVTCTAANTGPRGNFIAVRGRIIDGSGVGITPPASGFLTAGATSDDPQNVLDVLTAVRRHYLVSPYSDATQLAKFKTHVDAQDEPEIGHRKQIVAGSLDTPANVVTLATGLNFSRMQIVHLEKSDLPPGMLAAAAASWRSFQESTDTAHNFDNDVLAGVKPHYAIADRPLNSELVSMLNNGVTPLASTNSGEVFIVRSITTKSQDSSSKPDYRVLDTAKVTVSDEAADRFEIAFADRFANFKASDDPLDDEVAPPGVCTPSMCKDLAFEILGIMESDDGLLDLGSVEAKKDQIVFELSKIAKGRFNGVVPIDVIEGAHQYGVDIRQIG